MRFISKRNVKTLKVVGTILCGSAIALFLFGYFKFFYTLSFENINWKEIPLYILSCLVLFVTGILCGTVAELALDKLKRDN